MVIELTALVMASTILSGLNNFFELFIFLKSLVQLSLHMGNLNCLGIDLTLPLSRIAGQMFRVPSFYSC